MIQCILEYKAEERRLGKGFKRANKTYPKQVSISMSLISGCNCWKVESINECLGRGFKRSGWNFLVHFLKISHELKLCKNSIKFCK